MASKADIKSLWTEDGYYNDSITGASLVDQYPITLVHIVGFKIIKIWTNILQVLGGWGV